MHINKQTLKVCTRMSIYIYTLSLTHLHVRIHKHIDKHTTPNLILAVPQGV